MRRFVVAVGAALVCMVAVGGCGDADEPPMAQETPQRVPPPIIFDITWNSGKTHIAHGEEAVITLTMKNVWDRPVDFKTYPSSMTLTHVEKRTEDTIPLRNRGRPPDSLAPGDTLYLVYTVFPSVSERLQPGRYSAGVSVEIEFERPSRPEAGNRSFDIYSDVLLLVWGQGEGPRGGAKPTPIAPYPTRTSVPQTHTPDVALGEPSSLDAMLEGRLQAAIDNIPHNKKIWIDDETVVYLLPADPHDFNGAQVAVAHHLPSKAAITYDAPGADPYSEDVGDHPDARTAADRMTQNPKVADAVAALLGGKR